ncbi:hypothetical protein GPALN_011531 [Globodera pallida]|nr:hypothetical protein GPALN_011531 [Globodera pallida]
MNRVGTFFSKSLLVPRLSGQRFFASGPADPRQNVLVVIVDYNGEQQLHVNGKYSELLGRSPDFPFPGNVKPVAAELVQQMLSSSNTPASLDALVQTHTAISPGGVSIQKIVEPAFVVADDRRDALTVEHRVKLSQTRNNDDAQTTHCEWLVSGVDSIRMLWEEVNAMFSKRFAAGAEITVISLRANILRQPPAAVDEAATAQQQPLDGETVAQIARSAMLVPGYEFVKMADALCSALQRAGFWADFVDPRNGRPYRRRKARRRAEPSLGRQSLMLELDPQHTFSGLRIKTTEAAAADGGPTCKVIERAEWAEMDFLGQIFTEAPLKSKELQNILSDYAFDVKPDGREEDGG